MRFKSPWIEKKRKFQYNLVEEKRKELPMTKVVPISITISIEKGEGEKIEAELSSDTFPQDLAQLGQQMIELAGTKALSALDEQLRKEEYREGKVLRTEQRTYRFAHLSLSCKRRSYRMPDGSVCTPLDALMGFERYQRRSWEVMEQSCALASDVSYRKAAHLQSFISHNKTSPATICRDIRAVGERIQAQERAFQAEEAGQIKARVLYCESDGIWIALQHNKKKKSEIRVAITYTGKQWVSKGRKKLVNKQITAAMGIKSQKWEEMLRERTWCHYDLRTTKLVYVGGDGAEWVGRSFDLIGAMDKIRVLDRFHVKRAVSRAFGEVLDTRQVMAQIYKQGFESVEAQLMEATAKGDKTRVKDRLACMQYLRGHKEEIIPAPSMGSIESTIGKFVAQRMKTRGVSWSEKGAAAMLAVLMHKEELYEHSFPYAKPEVKKSEKRKRTKRENESVHQASFAILKTGKITTPYAKLFKNLNNANLPPSS